MQVEDAGKLHAELEVYGFPGEYQDPTLGAPHQGRTIAKVRLEEQQSNRRSGTGASNCPRLTAGHTFALVGHPRHELDQTYRLLHVTHVGHQPQVLDQDASGDSSYGNEFAVTEVKQPYRPPRRTPRPTMRGLQTATVVGPPGEEVFPDEHARVKVQFHWDRAEPFDETSSCWVRVSQLWAGNGWGALFLPRVGHEVLVDFLEGDPDRPVVVGRIYTGENRPPYPLPQQKTRSTIKSESSIGGGGSNELRFEDLKGSEEIYLHAQKDWNTQIGNNLGETVGASRTSTIGSAETITVGGSRTVSVGGCDSTSVGATHSVTITQPSSPAPAEGVGATSYTMSNTYYSVTTGEATITLTGPDVFIQANGKIVLDAANVQISARSGGVVVIQGGPMVHINPPAE
jgi:type VI secretion system secreted protein VgrG